jgi:hypothetical protein
MAVMRRGASWSFAVWIPASDGAPRGRRQVARGGYRTKWEAMSAERRYLVELEDDGAPASQPAGPTVGRFLVEWLVSSEPTRRPTTSVSYQYCAHAHLIPHLGEVPLRDLAPEHVRSWQAVLLRTPRRFRDGPLSTTTVRYCHRLVRRALQDALRWDLIDRNVCDAVVAPRRADTEMTVWSPADVPSVPRLRRRRSTRNDVAAVPGHRDATRRGRRLAVDRRRSRERSTVGTTHASARL